MKDKNKIRDRKSYKEFKVILKSIKKEDIDTTLWKIFHLLDNKNAFGSQKISQYAAESLLLLIKDEILPYIPNKLEPK